MRSQLKALQRMSVGDGDPELVMRDLLYAEEPKTKIKNGGRSKTTANSHAAHQAPMGGPRASLTEPPSNS